MQVELTHLNQRAFLIYFAILSAVLGALAVCLVVVGTRSRGAADGGDEKLVGEWPACSCWRCSSMVIAWSLLLREVYLAIRVGARRYR